MSGPWERYQSAASGPWTRYQAQEGSTSDKVAQAFGSGALANFGDEATAALRAAVPEFSNWMMKPNAMQEAQGQTGQIVSTAPTFQGRYDEELARERAKAKAFHETDPALALGSNIAGNVATTALALPAAWTAKGASLVGSMAKTGAVGAGLGGVSGFGEGEGTEDRLARGTLGAGIGGGIGAAFPVAGMVGRGAAETRLGRWIGDDVLSPLARMLMGTKPQSLSAAAPEGGQATSSFLSNLADPTQTVAQSGAVDRMANALQRSKMTPDRVQGRLGQLGDEAMLADVDPQFLSMARGAHTMPGETRTTAKTVLEARDKNSPDRMVRAFEGSEPPPTSFALRGENQAFDQYKRAVGSQAYGDMGEAGLKQSPELMALYENPIVARALDTVMAQEKATRIGTARDPASLVDIMHKVKQEIADQGVAATGRGASTQNYFRDLASTFVETFKRANPAVREADTAYRQAASLPEHFDAGRALLSGQGGEVGIANSAPGLADLLMRADPMQRLAARSGSTNAAREAAYKGPDQAVALAKNVDTNRFTQGKIGELYEPAQAREIGRVSEATRTFRQTKNEILGGSKTADKAAEIPDLGNASVRVGTGGGSARLIERIGDILSRVSGPNEAVRNEIGRIMLNPNSSENQRILALAAELLQKRAAGTPLRAGISSAGGSIAGGQ